MSINSYNKYIKYKTKYENLLKSLNQTGGSDDDEYILIWVRHGFSCQNANKGFGHLLRVEDPALTDLGILQAQKTGELYQDIFRKSDIFIFSPLYRTYETLANVLIGANIRETIAHRFPYINENRNSLALGIDKDNVASDIKYQKDDVIDDSIYQDNDIAVKNSSKILNLIVKDMTDEGNKNAPPDYEKFMEKLNKKLYTDSKKNTTLGKSLENKIITIVSHNHYITAHFKEKFKGTPEGIENLDVLFEKVKFDFNSNTYKYVSLNQTDKNLFSHSGRSVKFFTDNLNNTVAGKIDYNSKIKDLKIPGKDFRCKDFSKFKEFSKVNTDTTNEEVVLNMNDDLFG